MKKVVLLFVAVVGFVAISNNVSAQTKTTTEKATVKTEQAVTAPSNFVDKDKNGICDKHEAKAKNGKAHCDKKDGKANCDGKGKANCEGKCEGKKCGHEKGNAKGCGNHKGIGDGKDCKHEQAK